MYEIHAEPPLFFSVSFIGRSDSNRIADHLLFYSSALRWEDNDT